MTGPFDSLVSTLAFPPISDVTDSIIDLKDNNNLPQELVSCFETHYIGVERGQGLQSHKVEPTFPIELGSIYQQTYTKDKQCGGFPNTTESSVTNRHLSFGKLIPLLMKEETLTKKKKCDAKLGDKSTTTKKSITL